MNLHFEDLARSRGADRLRGAEQERLVRRLGNTTAIDRRRRPGPVFEHVSGLQAQVVDTST